MGEFRDYLEEKGLSFINESPKQIETESYSRLTKLVLEYVNKYKVDLTELEYIGNNVYWYKVFTGNDGDLFSGYDFIFYIENGEILGASVLKRIMINNGSTKSAAYEAIITTNFTKKKVKGLLYKLYSIFSKYKKTYIVSGMQQTPESKKVWMRWLREKENIKEIFGYHYKEKKFLDYKQISNYWDVSDKMQERRIVVKFK